MVIEGKNCVTPIKREPFLDRVTANTHDGPDMKTPSVFALSTVFALACSTAFANDAPIGGIDPALTTDIRGFEIGMNAQQALAHFETTYPDASARTSERRHRETGQTFVSLISYQAPQEKLFLFFTGHYSGNQLYAIKREVTYPRDNQASFPDTKAAVLAKYGLPTYAPRENQLSYVFAPELVMFGSAEVVQAMIDADDIHFNGFLDLAREQENGNQRYMAATRCVGMIEQVQNTQFFNPLEASGTLPENCTAAMDIQMQSRGDLLRGYTVTLADFQRVMSAAEIDRREAQALQVEQQPTAATPDL